MGNYPQPSKGNKLEPKRASDKVRKLEAGHPWKTGESIYQHDGNDVVLDAGDPEPKG